MSLRLQLLALALLTLLLPWAGLRFLQSAEASLRGNYEQQLLAIADTVASLIAGNPGLAAHRAPAPGLDPPLYVHALTEAVAALDGSRSDWQYADAVPGAGDESRAFLLADGSRIWLADHGAFLYLYAEIADDEFVPQRTPGQAPHGDRVVLVFGRDPERPESLLLASTVDSSFRAQVTPGGDRFESTGAYDDNVRGYLRETETGYAIEARLTLGLLDRPSGSAAGAGADAASAGTAQPPSYEGGLGIGIIDTDGRTAGWAAATWAAAPRPNMLRREWPELDALLRPYEDGERRFRVLDPDGWVLADTGPLALSVRAAAASEPSLRERFFRYTLRREDPAYATLESRPGRIGDPAVLAALETGGVTSWYGIGNESSAIVAAAVPVLHEDPRLGLLLLEQTSDPVLTLESPPTQRLMATTGLIIPIAVVLLLGFASLLSFRIRRLARAAESALGPRGEIRVAVPGTRSRDEIGSLARSFADLLGRLRDYTDYLQSLKSKLSHELRTPLAIVATSLDNLEQESSSATSRAYLERLRQGANRLESILQAMTAATRVEQAITQTELERFDIGAVVAGSVASYRDVYAGQRFELEVPERPVPVDGSGELIAQLLDKLVDNAVSFAAAGTAIEVRLDGGDGDGDGSGRATGRATGRAGGGSTGRGSGVARLTVTNRGPLLPEAMRHRLFDSLVSVRASGGARAHLGLGLYIVTLIAEFHGGSVIADNLDDGSGVRIGVVLPRADAGAA